MPIAKTIAEQLEHSSWIRRMFEEGARLKRERGAENVYDYTLGNPDVEPPAAVIEALRRVVAENRPRSHGYMPNAGFPEVRRTIAGLLHRTWSRCSVCLITRISSSTFHLYPNKAAISSFG